MGTPSVRSLESTDHRPVGELLRYWRGLRGRSQLDLAGDAGMSQRHLSFVESGRSLPSRSVLLALVTALDVPLRERNLLLLAAGYAPVYSGAEPDAGENAMVWDAIGRLLGEHEPHPALVLDRWWNVVRVNDAAPHLFGQMVQLEEWPWPRNLVRLMLSPKGLRPSIVNWNEVATALLARVYREAVGRVMDARTAALLREVQTYPGVPELDRWRPSDGPAVPVEFLLRRDGGERRLRYMSLVATVGTPQSEAAEELRVELMFPV